MSKTKKPFSKKIVVVFIILLVFISAGAFLYLQFLNANLLAEVGKEKLYKNDLKSAIFAATDRGTPEDPGNTSKDERLSALYNMIDSKVLDAELKKEGIQISENDLVSAAKEKYKGYDKKNSASQKAYKDYVKAEVARKKLGEKVVTWKEGYAIFCRFDRADQDDMKTKPAAKKTKEGHKVYAENYCKNMKKRLETGKSDYNTEVSNLLKNPILGESSWRPYHVSFQEKFDKKTFNPLSFQYAYDEFDQIKNMGIKQSYSTILVSDKNNIASFYSVVYLSGKGNEGKTTDFDKWFSDIKNSFGIKIYKDKL